ncbi:hypothetical protein ACC862_24070 [Rhizobium ruizarguesonis]
MSKELAAARLKANEAYAAYGFHSKEYNEAFEAVRAITTEMVDDAPKEEFCSIDSGIHRTRLLSGRLV